MKSTIDLATVPTLDGLAAKPEIAHGLPRNVLLGLSLRAQAVVTACALALIEAPATSVADDIVLDVTTAAARLGLKPRTLKNRARKDSRYRALLVDNGTRLLRFSASRIEAFKAGKLVATRAGADQLPEWLATRRRGGQST